MLLFQYLIMIETQDGISAAKTRGTLADIAFPQRVVMEWLHDTMNKKNASCILGATRFNKKSMKDLAHFNS